MLRDGRLAAGQSLNQLIHWTLSVTQQVHDLPLVGLGQDLERRQGIVGGMPYWVTKKMRLSVPPRSMSGSVA